MARTPSKILSAAELKEVDKANKQKIKDAKTTVDVAFKAKLAAEKALETKKAALAKQLAADIKAAEKELGAEVKITAKAHEAAVKALAKVDVPAEPKAAE